MVTLMLAASVVTSDFVTAVAVGESRLNYKAVGDEGRAVGAWQMHKPAWEDARKHLADAGMVWYPWSMRHQPHAQRTMAQAYLALCEIRLRKIGVVNPTQSQVYLSFSMGVSGFASCGLDPNEAPPVKRRGLERVLNATTQNTIK